MKAIVSFPRSGNHLARYIVEYMTGKATQGCFQTDRDVAICNNRFPDHENVLAHVDKTVFVAQKSHSKEELGRYQREQLLSFSGFLLIIRNPKECIPAFSGRAFIRPEVSHEKRLANLFSRWSALVSHVARTPQPSAVLAYRDLISEDPRRHIPLIDAIAELFRHDVLQEKLANLKADYPKHLAISASGQGRVWRGVRSIGKSPHFHVENLGDNLRRTILEQIDRKLREFLHTEFDEVPNLSAKYPRAIQVREQLLSFL